MFGRDRLCVCLKAQRSSYKQGRADTEAGAPEITSAVETEGIVEEGIV